MSSLPNSSSSSDAPGVDPLGWLVDVPCPVEFVLGTSRVRVRDCLSFAPNSIVRLSQSAGSDLEIHVGGVPLAAGEVVIIDENVGMRLNRILPPSSQVLS
jgi:flagellar motor switch protein FliN/FliY